MDVGPRRGRSRNRAPLLAEPPHSESRPSELLPPLLLEWKHNADGSLSGLVFNKHGMADGSWLKTSIVRSMTVVNGETHAATASGTTYALGEQEQQQAPDSGGRGTRRSHRTHVTNWGGVGFLRSLEPYTEAVAAVLKTHGLSYVCGGAEAGGLAADALLRASFASLDPNIVNLRGKYSSAERVVLLDDGRVAAAAVVQARMRDSFIANHLGPHHPRSTVCLAPRVLSRSMRASPLRVCAGARAAQRDGGADSRHRQVATPLRAW